MLNDEAILKKIAQQPKHFAGFKQLVRELGVHGVEERRALNDRLQKLVERGDLVEDGDRYALPKTSGKNLVTGRLSMHRDGYGFVVPEAEEVRARISGDIYIHPHAVGSAMHGDRVLVEIGAVRPDGRAEGRILRVVGRAHNTVVGTLHYGDRYNYVTPMDEKITQDIVIPRGQEIPSEDEVAAAEEEHRRRVKTRSAGGAPSPRHAGGESRHRVLGEEAFRRPTDWEDLEGVVVDVEITEWPSATQNPRGRVIEILGHEDDFGVDVEIIIRKYHIPHRFPAEVLDEAQRIEAIIAGRELRQRRDYRDLPIVTIDGETARDFDDAVLVRRLDNGNYELQVHIADVAQYVREGSALDREARVRGTSVYFPDRAVPMLPLELSTDACSLRPHLDRLVMSCVMEIDHHGEVLGYEISPGIIRSAERMTYTDVNAVLEGDAALRRRYAPLVENFELMRDLAQILNRKRVRRGSIDFDLPEPVIEFDEHGLMKSIVRSERNVAHRLIEEFMLAANESVASYLEFRVPSLYRIHEKPDPRRVYDFENIAAAFGYSLGVGALPVRKFAYTDQRRPGRGPGPRTRSGQQRREIELPEEVHITPRMYQKLTQKIAGKPEERILSYLMLRSLKQARYSEINEGHFALAAPTYTHFTSPIRRYPDLIVHRILKQVLRDHAEEHDDAVPVGRGVPPASEAPQPWSKRLTADGRRPAAAVEVQSPWAKGSPKRAGHKHRQEREHVGPAAYGWSGERSSAAPIPEPVLHQIAEESSESERRADDAERELMEWKKVKFMQDRVGEDFRGLIISVTKFGFFVELDDLFIEGLVPLASLTDDRYVFHENTREIIGQHSKKKYALGDRVQVLVDRIDWAQHKIQFATIDEQPSRAQRKHRKRSF
ncbi:MAG TPA: RNB domain-containing ribonuclease [Terriglobales bacterium]|nr:RNB domain-containing ribonuclease [Terriglobales bacterium]